MAKHHLAQQEPVVHYTRHPCGSLVFTSLYGLLGGFYLVTTIFMLQLQRIEPLLTTGWACWLLTTAMMIPLPLNLFLPKLSDAYRAQGVCALSVSLIGLTCLAFLQVNSHWRQTYHWYWLGLSSLITLCLMSMVGICLVLPEHFQFTSFLRPYGRKVLDPFQVDFEFGASARITPPPSYTPTATIV